MIYHFGPARRSRWRHDLPGAITAAVMWWLLSTGFGWYVSLTEGANDVTAAVGAGLLALTWMWLAAQVLLIGGVVNFLYGQNRHIARNRPTWNINDKITGEWRRIQERADGEGRAAPAPTGRVTVVDGERRPEQVREPNRSADADEASAAGWQRGRRSKPVEPEPVSKTR